ncbi:MAG: hypothetical protein BGO69_14895 [Bacteroidetes bacterium 46-16]|nr:MAG: hypothetical protein BGO69_14895 [Bacteroidetes bacterium 46-16]
MKNLKYIVVASFLLLHNNRGFAQTLVEPIRYKISGTASLKPEPVSGQFKFKSFNSSATYAPLLLTAYGLLAIENDPLKHINAEFQEEILEHHANFRTTADNYLQFSPALAVFSLKFSGNRGQNNMFNSIKLCATSTLLMAGTVYALKITTREMRPDGSARTSFPSGHTATAFAGAEFFHQEFKNTSPLLSYSGYLAATATGTLRMYNNKHYFSDVIAGAGIGILSTKAAYWINSKLFRNKGTHSVNPL